MVTDVPMILLCGGRGLALQTRTGLALLNKGLVPIRRTPMFWWLLSHYAFYGFRDFTLAIGSHFGGYREALEFGFGATAMGRGHEYRLTLCGHTCTVRLVDSGVNTGTGERLMACSDFVRDARNFAVTYSDTLADVDLDAEFHFHCSTGLSCTLLAAKLPVRFRVLGIREDEYLVRKLASQPVMQGERVNGGFFFFSSYVWNHATVQAPPAGFAIETDLLEPLAASEQLAAYMHSGDWQHIDGVRDIAGIEAVTDRLTALWNARK